jgi:hypothetical protein
MSSSGRQPWDANDPYPGDEGPECDHEDYDADILTGLATCGRCGHRWTQTAEEIAREREAEIAFEAAMSKGRPCIRCGNDLDATPGGHICGVSDDEWAKAADDGMPF